jgi:hypothetical protein
MGKAIPTSNTATKHAKDLGPDAWHEYLNLRERYKGEGLTPKEAKDRAYVELKIAERWMDLKRRHSLSVVMGSQVPLTPVEMEQVAPNYQRPGLTKAEEIGDQEMSLPEQVKWAMRQAAKFQNGELQPTRFPCEGALFWYQSAVGNRREFEKLLLRVEAPGGDAENLYLQDSQYQYSQIEKQIQEALRECGERLVEMEAGFREKLLPLEMDDCGEVTKTRD